MSLSKLWGIVKGREDWSAAVHGATESQTWLSNSTTATYLFLMHFGETTYRKEFSLPNRTDRRMDHFIKELRAFQEESFLYHGDCNEEEILNQQNSWRRKWFSKFGSSFFCWHIRLLSDQGRGQCQVRGAEGLCLDECFSPSLFLPLFFPPFSNAAVVFLFKYHHYRPKAFHHADQF